MNPFRILTLADIHGNLKATKKLITYLRDNSIEIDLIAIAGDLPATTSLLVMAQYMLRHPFQALSKFLYTKWVYKNGGRKFFIKKQINSAISILNELAVFQVPIIYIPGNVDTFEALKAIEEYPKAEIFIIDSPTEISSFTFVGAGGALVRYPESILLCDHEFLPDEYAERWRKNSSTSSADIMLTHEPPAFEVNVHGENRVKIGSTIISEIINGLKPRLVIFGHYHELPIVHQTREITYVNPGPLACYYYALIDIRNEKITASINKIPPTKLDPINMIYSHRTPKNSLYNTLEFI